MGGRAIATLQARKLSRTFLATRSAGGFGTPVAQVQMLSPLLDAE